MNAATAAKPAGTSDVVLAAAVNAFTDWSGAVVTDASLKSDQFAFYFQKTGDSVYFEAGSTEDVWLTEGVSSSAANVDTSGFTFVGAVNLAVAATSVILGSLLF